MASDAAVEAMLDRMIAGIEKGPDSVQKRLALAVMRPFYSRIHAEINAGVDPTEFAAGLASLLANMMMGFALQLDDDWAEQAGTCQQLLEDTATCLGHILSDDSRADFVVNEIAIEP